MLQYTGDGWKTDKPGIDRGLVNVIDNCREQPENKKAVTFFCNRLTINVTSTGFKPVTF
jgi:hypothetical protein